MKASKIIGMILVAASLSACAEGALNPYRDKTDKTVDRGFDKKHVSQLVAGIWVDPQGCDHWIIDDGVEGYLSPRVDKYGMPVCSGVAEPTEVVGPFKDGSAFGDPI